MFRNVIRIIASASCALVFVFIFANTIRAESMESISQSHPELTRMKTILDCTCQCGLSLAYCEVEDADCSVRPALLTKLNKLLDDGKMGMDLILGFMGPIHPVKAQLMEARLQKRHAVLSFYQEGCGECYDVKDVLEEGSLIWGDKVMISEVDINKDMNDQIRREFRVFSTPTVLIVAPNGVVVRELRENITVESVESAFVTPVMAQILRGLQDRRVIFLTVMATDWQNASSIGETVSNVGDILRNSVRIVHADPTDTEEGSVLEVLGVDDNQNQGLTYVISQSGSIGSRFEGPVSRKDLFLAFQKVLAARSGCGGSGSGLGGNTCK